jgi:hypothetical protein
VWQNPLSSNTSSLNSPVESKMPTVKTLNPLFEEKCLSARNGSEYSNKPRFTAIWASPRKLLETVQEEISRTPLG